MYGPLAFLFGLASSIPQVLEIHKTGDVSSFAAEGVFLSIVSLVLWLFHYMKMKPGWTVDVVSTIVALFVQLFIFHNILKQQRDKSDLLVHSHSVPGSSSVNENSNQPHELLH